MDRQYVGIDFHRRRSVIVRLSGSGERPGLHRIVNEPFELAKVIALCGEAPQVVIEATYGWYWAVDLSRVTVRRRTGARARLRFSAGVGCHRLRPTRSRRCAFQRRERRTDWARFGGRARRSVGRAGARRLRDQGPDGPACGSRSSSHTSPNRLRIRAEVRPRCAPDAHGTRPATALAVRRAR